MRIANCLFLASVLACLVAVIAGCGSSGSSEKPAESKQPMTGAAASQDTARQASSGKKTPKKPRPKVDEPPPKPTISKVYLSTALRATCLVQAGDPFPEAELPDLQGKTQDLKGLYGQKLTVVGFWTVRDSKFTAASAIDMLQTLQRDFAEPFAEKGVRVVGIGVESPPEVVGQVVSQAAAQFVNLLDPQRAFLAKVATDKLPRVYLLDATGKILWFDLEYSRDTRRKMLDAIQAVLEN